MAVFLFSPWLVSFIKVGSAVFMSLCIPKSPGVEFSLGCGLIVIHPVPRSVGLRWVDHLKGMGCQRGKSVIHRSAANTCPHTAGGDREGS